MPSAADYRKDLNSEEISAFLDLTHEIADHIRSELHDFPAQIRVTHKPGNAGAVTEFDRRVELDCSAIVQDRYPCHGIVGEESLTINRDADIVWMIDPIDGTDDFARGSPLFASIITVLYRGTPVVGVIEHPMLRIRTEAAFGLGARCSGQKLDIDGSDCGALRSAVVFPAYDDYRHSEFLVSRVRELGAVFPNQRIYRNAYGHTMVAGGKFSACIEVEQNMWDIAASQLIIEEANGLFVPFQVSGTGYRNRRISAVFGQTLIVNKVLALLR